MSSRKPPSNRDDWDDFDIPKWDESAPSVPSRSYPSSSRRTTQRPSTESRSAYPAEPFYDDYQPPAAPTREPRPQAPPSRLSNRVPTRTTRPAQDPYRDPYSEFDEAYVGDPYYPEPDYGRTPARSASSQYDLYADPAAAELDWVEPAPEYDEPRQPSRRQRQRTRASRPSVHISRPAIADGTLAAIAGAGVLGLLVLVGLVWWGVGDLDGLIPWHLNASGDVDHWVTNSTLWRIPFGVFVSMAFGLIAGFYLRKRDQFAARFILVSMCLVQIVAWVAVVDQLW
ncbi:MAG: hypothetical protein M9947_06260 [Thermomicrobiales bacterium]|nr:hypothetical protein [Thermomicrobiales bacterium]